MTSRGRAVGLLAMVPWVPWIAVFGLRPGGETLGIGLALAALLCGLLAAADEHVRRSRLPGRCGWGIELRLWRWRRG